jgi:hypothetical protein
LEYSYAAAKARVEHILKERQKKRLQETAKKKPDGRIGQAARQNGNYTKNATRKSDLPRSITAIINRLELNYVYGVYRDASWVPSERMKGCRFCSAEGPAQAWHLLYDCPNLSEHREKAFGTGRVTPKHTSDIMRTATYIHNIASECREIDAAALQNTG